jgi:hypothetical protein
LELQWEYDPREHEDDLLTQHIVPALRKWLKETPKKIVLDWRKVNSQDMYPGSGEHTLLPIGSFNDFTALKHLDMPRDMFIGRQGIARPLTPGTTTDQLLEEEGGSHFMALIEYSRSVLRHAPEHERVPVSESSSGIGEPADWAALTDVFPAQLETLVLQTSEPHELARRISEIWHKHFIARKEERLPGLRTLDIVKETCRALRSRHRVDT